ncbi:MAG TPA: hypothetical protein VJY54_03835 [Lachnospiraceae bacterium]|nr:hypothetical protein [Lachnospiraceae bacterium]
MTRKRKHIVFTLLLQLFAFSMCACDISNQKTESNHFDRTEIFISRLETYNDIGMTHIDGRNILHFYDPESNNAIALCAKPNCEHLGESRNNPNPTCDAYVQGTVFGPAIINNKLYYLVSPPYTQDNPNGYYHQEFYQADVNGTNREKIAEVDDIPGFYMGIYENGYLACTYMNDSDVSGASLEKQEAGICLLNLDTKKLNRIYKRDHYEGCIHDVMIRNGKLYYIYTYTTEKLDFSDLNEIMTEEFQKHMNTVSQIELWKYNIDTGEEELVWQNGGTMLYHLAYGYLVDIEEENAYLLNVETNERIELEHDLVMKKGISICEDGIIIVGDGQVTFWDYQLKSMENIGTYKEEQDFFLASVTDKWVYSMYLSDGEYLPGCISREKFMNGDFNWMSISTK